MNKNKRNYIILTVFVICLITVSYFVIKKINTIVVNLPKPASSSSQTTFKYQIPQQSQPIIVQQPQIIQRAPEYRQPPTRTYKPGNFQQMGILVGNDGTLPLYGKEHPHRRNDYIYYTTTPGNQIYPISISHNNRDCMDDRGCSELLGDETVSVLGRSGEYTVKMYNLGRLF